jgi:hypothetical protein
MEALNTVYGYPLQRWHFSAPHQGTNQRVSKRQIQLYDALREIFPTYAIRMNYSKRAKHRVVELDIYLPDLKLAFEYQGEQHYMNVQVYNPVKVQQQRDAHKRQVCSSPTTQVIGIYRRL